MRELARSVFDSMAMVFGEDEHRRLSKDFRYERYSNAIQFGDGQVSVNAIPKDDEFTYTQLINQEGDPYFSTDNTVTWRWPSAQ